MIRPIILLLLFAPFLLASSPQLSMPSVDEAVRSAKLIVQLFDAGRIVVGEFQEVINDKTKGDKGFTPEVFEERVREKFHDTARISLDRLDQDAVPAQARRLLPVLLDVQKSVIQERQSLINLQGVGFKGFIPASFGTTVSLRFRSMSDVYLKQTALQVRNPRNRPEPYEKNILEQFASKAYPHGEIFSESVNKGTEVRVMVPLYYHEHCLQCHGGPQGARDKTGHAKEGGKLGELGGAISVRLHVQ